MTTPGALPVPFGPPRTWSEAPRTLLATHDAERVVVWQAHAPEVAEHALRAQRFSGVPGWRLDRTTRLRVSLPSLAWRTAYGARPGRERLLAVTLAREGFDEIVRRAIPAEYSPETYPSEASFRLATKFASATVSWHPDRDGAGAEVPWETARFGIRGSLLDTFARSWVLGIADHTAWLADRSVVPEVRPYPLDPGATDVR